VDPSQGFPRPGTASNPVGSIPFRRETRKQIISARQRPATPMSSRARLPPHHAATNARTDVQWGNQNFRRDRFPTRSSDKTESPEHVATANVRQATFRPQIPQGPMEGSSDVTRKQNHSPTPGPGPARAGTSRGNSLLSPSNQYSPPSVVRRTDQPNRDPYPTTNPGYRAHDRLAEIAT